MKVKAPGFRVRSSYEVAFSPDGELLATVGRGVALWSVPARKRLRSTTLLSHPSDVSFSPSGRTFAVKSTRGELLIAETPTTDPVARFMPAGHDEGAALHYLSESELVDGSWDGSIRVWSLPKLRAQTVWHEANCMVTHVLPGSYERPWVFVVTAKHDHPKFSEGADRIFLAKEPSGELAPLPRRWTFLRGAALSPDGTRFAVRSGASNPVLEVVDARSGDTLAAINDGPGGTGYALAWSPDGTVLVVVERGGFSMRSTSTLQEVGWLPAAYPAAIAFSPSQDLIALGAWQDGLVVPWSDLLVQSAPRVPTTSA